MSNLGRLVTGLLAGAYLAAVPLEAQETPSNREVQIQQCPSESISESLPPESPYRIPFMYTFKVGVMPFIVGFFYNNLKAVTLDSTSSLEEWVYRGNFTKFELYELDSENQPMEFPSAIGRVRGSTMYVNTDLFTESGDGSLITVPDGIHDHFFCTPIQGFSFKDQLDAYSSEIARMRGSSR